ncbi:uncharacterized protein LOC113846789 isoform X4 [Abrus precatorius]|uniref:Uncharacterized protein LOC113846789 isoform X4 n=1 Tax=Abrus precatorius TaxID=3816 RepID=A0A8B8JJ34_ABRPR|nr:uncharacterized protein LOC113846789 isoform X4 [Abrus precatorius]
MDIDQTTVSAPEERGAGGELRKLSASPYACPTESVRRRWISKLVDPAYRLIAGRATRILPSFLSPAPPLSALPSPTSDVEDQDRWRTGDSLEDYSRRSNIHLLASKSTEMASTSGISGKLKSSSDLVLSRQDEKGEQSDKSRLSDIEGLVKGKKFSRDEFDHLVKVLNSRAMDLSYVERGKENANLISRKDDSGLAMAHVLPTVSDEQRQEVLTGTIRGSPSPFGLPKDKSKVGASESGYGSVGPIRRIRHKVGTQSSSRRPAYSSGVVERFTSIAKSMDPDATSCIHKPLSFEVGVPLPTAHMHTSLMAKKILDHIDRNIPTPKEKSAELKMAMKWKNPESSTDFSTILSDEDNGLVKLKDVSPYKYDGIYGKKSTLRNDVKGNYHVDMQPKESTQKSMNVRKEGTLTSDINVCSSIPSLSNVASTTQNFDGSQNLLTSSKEDALKTLPCGSHPCVVNQERKPLTNSAASKPVLPPISIKKPKSRWTLESDNGSGFTFPISTSSSVFSEPPTPSIMPLLSTGDQRQLKERSTEPPYSFGLKKSSPAVVFSFPSTSNTAVQNDAGDIKFNFGSTENPRLSFSFGKNAVCC